jgi:hypothetical protein
MKFLSLPIRATKTSRLKYHHQKRELTHFYHQITIKIVLIYKKKHIKGVPPKTKHLLAT